MNRMTKKNNTNNRQGDFDYNMELILVLWCIMSNCLLGVYDMNFIHIILNQSLYLIKIGLPIVGIVLFSVILFIVFVICQYRDS